MLRRIDHTIRHVDSVFLVGIVLLALSRASGVVGSCSKRGGTTVPSASPRLRLWQMW